MMPLALGIMGMTLAGGPVGFAISTGAMTAVEGQVVYEDLLNAGAPEDRASQMALVAGSVIGLLENVGRIPVVKQVSPLLFGQFKRQAASQLAKRGLAEAVKRFGKNFTIAEFSEIITEVAQEVVGNVAVGFYDENRDVLANTPDIAVKTAIGVLPFSILGGAASIRMVSPTEMSGLSDMAKKAKGWVTDAKGNWYEAVKGEEGAIVPGAEPGGEVTPTPEVTLPKTLEDNLLPVLRGEVPVETLEEQIRNVYTPEKADAIREALTARLSGLYDQVQAREGKLPPTKLPVSKLITREQFGEVVDKLNIFFRTLSKVEATIPKAPVTPEVTQEAGMPEAPTPTEGATARVFSRIQTEPAETGFVDKVKRGWHKFNIKMVDDLDPLKRITDQLKKGGVNLSIEENPYLLARLLRGVTSKATSFLEQGTFGKEFWKMENGKAVPNYTGESLDAILQEVKEPVKWRDFSTYLTARRAVELSERGIETGIEVGDAQASITELEGQYKNFPELAERVYKYQDSLLVYSQEMGLLSKELLGKLRKYGNYVPFYRVFNELQAKGLMGKKMANIASPIKRIKGSEREIINPLESIVKNTYVLISAAERNQVGIALANLVDQNPELADVFERVKTPMTRVAQVSAKELGVEVEGLTSAEEEQMVDIFRPSFFISGDEVTVLIDGKKNYYKVDADLRDSLLHLNRETLGMMGQILGAPARWLRAGATLSPDFMFRNPARDQLTAFAYSNYGFMPGIDFIRGLASMIGKDSDYKLFRMSGAEHSMLVSMDRSYLQKTFKQIVEGKGFTEYVKNPMELFRIISELGEKATRLGEFKKGIKSGAVPLEAGYSARSVTLDFAQMGTTAQAINTFIAFFNANLRGWGKMVSSFKEHPIRTSAKVFAGITLPSILLWMVNYDDDRWKEIPQWQKDLFWIVMTKDNIYRIPKPFELGIIFGSVPERFLDWLVEKDPNLMKDIAQTLIESGSPGFIPTAGLPIIEWMTNYSFFKGRNIVPESRKAMPPQLQYTQWTTEVSKKLGELLKLPPAQIDNLFFAWTGGLGRYATDILDAVMKGTGISTDIPEPSPTLADTPVIKAFVVRNPYGSAGETVNDFYDSLEKIEAGEKYLKEMLVNGEIEKFDKYKAAHPELLFFADFDSGRYQEAIEKGETPKDVFYSASARYLRRVASELSELGKKEDLIYKATDISPEEKRRLVDEIEILKTDVARQALDLLMGKQFKGEDFVDKSVQIFQYQIDETVNRLGEVIEEASPLSLEKSDIHSMGDVSSDLSTILEAVTDEDLRKLHIEEPIAYSYIERRAVEESIKPLINSKVYDLDLDLKEDVSFEDYYKQWQEGFIKESPLNTLSKRQVDLLRRYKAIETENGKATFLEGLSDNERKQLTVNPRKDWLENHPEENALLAVWGKSKLLTAEAYNEFVKLYKFLDIPDNALPEDIVPEHLDTFLLKTEAKFRDIEDKLVDARLLDDKIKDEDGLTAQARAVQELKQMTVGDGLTFADTERKIVAIEVGTPEEPTDSVIVESWVDRGKTIDEFGAGSSEAKVWLLDHPDEWQWALENGLLTDDGTEWNEAKLRLQVDNREQEVGYDAIRQGYTDMTDVDVDNLVVPAGMNPEAWVLKTAKQKREWLSQRDEDDFLTDDPEYAEAKLRIKAYEFGLTDEVDDNGLSNVDKWMGYNQLPLYGSWRDRFLANDLNFFNAVTDLQKGKGVKPWDAPPDNIPSIEYDNIYEEWKDDFEKWDSYEDPESLNFIPDDKARDTTRQSMLFTTGYQTYSGVSVNNKKATSFALARWERDGYKLLVPDNYIDTFVLYKKVSADGEGKPKGWKAKTKQDGWYEDDWFMQEHIDDGFYKNVYMNPDHNNGVQHDKWDFRKVPPREVFNQYLAYLNRPVGKARDDYRANHLEFDAWLVLKFDYTPIEEKKQREGFTPLERAKEDIWKQEQEWEKQLEEIEKILAGMR